MYFEISRLLYRQDSSIHNFNYNACYKVNVILCFHTAENNMLMIMR